MKTQTASVVVLSCATVLACSIALAQQPPEPVVEPPVGSVPVQDPPADPVTDSPDADKAGQLASPDQAFLDQALLSGQKEVHAAKLAQERSADDDVRELAALIERDHRELNAKLEAAGARAGHAGHPNADGTATPPAGNPDGMPKGDGVDHAAALASDPQLQPLVAAQGAAFDRVYLDMLVRMHTASIAKFEAAAEGQETPVQSLAEQALPGLRRHAAMASSLRDAMAQE